MASNTFLQFVRALLKGDADFDTLTCKIMLLDSALTASELNTLISRADITNELATGNGYLAGGIAQTFTLAAATDATAPGFQLVTYDNIVAGWTNATFVSPAAIIYKNTGDSATDLLMHYLEFTTPISPVNGPVDITYSNSFKVSRGT
jgi:hypothetical protein